MLAVAWGTRNYQFEGSDIQRDQSPGWIPLVESSHFPCPNPHSLRNIPPIFNVGSNSQSFIQSFTYYITMMKFQGRGNQSSTVNSHVGGKTQYWAIHITLGSNWPSYGCIIIEMASNHYHTFIYWLTLNRTSWYLWLNLCLSLKWKTKWPL